LKESKLKTFVEFVKMKDDPCWKGYKMVGSKKLKGKTVPNCVKETDVKERSTSQLAGNLLSLMADDTTFDEVKDSMRKVVVSSPLFQVKNSLAKRTILADIDKARNVRDFEKVTKKYNLEALLVT
jgi:hypothetical protein